MLDQISIQWGHLRYNFLNYLCYFRNNATINIVRKVLTIKANRFLCLIGYLFLCLLKLFANW